jgi:cell wall-associated NlpC family hydrolase
VAGRPESGAPDESSTPGTSGGSGGNGGSGDTGNTGDTSDPDTSGSVSDKIERVIDRGMTQLGVQYAWGGGNWFGPTLGIRDGGVADSYGDYAKTGFDCSGLMMYAFYAVGIQLDHYSGYQYTAGTQVPVDQAKRGDMLFWGPGGGTHVALYLGDGKMLEAPESGSDVHVSDVRWDGIQPMATRMIE